MDSLKEFYNEKKKKFLYVKRAEGIIRICFPLNYDVLLSLSVEVLLCLYDDKRDCGFM